MRIVKELRDNLGAIISGLFHSPCKAVRVGEIRLSRGKGNLAMQIVARSTYFH